MTTRSFGNTETRFNQYKPNNRPSPNKYRLGDAFSPKSTYSKPVQYTFGVSRKNMKKLFVENIITSPYVKNSPSPNNYEKEKKNGIGNIGKMYTLRPRPFASGIVANKYDSQHFKNAHKLPGPG